ncbi:MAG: dihydropteroate synthase, partial [Thermoguttaceae bacterium]
MLTAIEQRADRWALRSRTLTFGDTPLLMGIVNVTPDSFSDGGRFLDADAAIEHGLRLVAAGADLLDIGGESTRPGSDSVDVQEELRRVMPVLGALCQQAGVPVSIDTTKALVARHALHAGAEIINDITALEGDPAMLPLAVESGCGVCLMHMRGTPKTMQNEPVYADVVAEVADYLRGRRDALLAAGIAQSRIALDPGIGFAKTTAHNLELLANAWRLHALGCPVLVGHSRKHFLATPHVAPTADASARQAGQDAPEAVRAATLPLAPGDRTAGTIGVALSLARQGVQVIRVHDVAAVRQALFFFQATGGLA